RCRGLGGPDPREPLVALAFRADGARLASASRDATARIWDARTGELLRTLAGHPSDVVQVVFVPPGHERVLTVDLDARSKRWDEAGVPEDVVRADDGIVHTLASADGKR